MYRLCMFMCLSSIVIGSKALVAPFIKPCPALDKACLLNSANIALPYMSQGVPDIGIPPLDPFQMNDVIKADSGDLKLAFRNMVVRELGKATVISIERDPATSSASLIVETPIFIQGIYTAGGKLAFIDIKGDGPFEIKGKKLRVEVDLKLKSVNIHGKQHYKISSFDFKYDPVERFTIQLENLFDGDKSKAEPIQKILNESWRDLILEVGKPVIKEVITKIVQSIGKLFHAIPSEELEIV